MSRPRALRPTWPFTWALLTLLSAPPVLATPAETAGWKDGLTVEQLDLRNRSGSATVAWDVTGFAGSTRQGLWLRADGESESGGQSASRLELLWGRPVLRTTEFLVGVRHDSGTLPSRTYAAMGVQALAAGPLQWDFTGYLGDGSSRADVHVGARLQGRYSWQLARQWSVRVRTEVEYWNEDHERFAAGTGSGPCEVRASLRLGYAADSRIGYYVGAEWLHQLQDTAELTEAAGGEARDLGLVVGLRLAL